MSLPRAVLEAEEKANRLHQELLQQQQTPESTDTQATEGQPTNQPAPSEKEPPKQTGDSAPPVGQQDEQLEHRYKVLQGKYNSEVPRLAAENKDLKSRLSSLEEQIEALKAKPPEPLVKPEEIEEYGPGLVDLARRIAREEILSKQNEIDSLRAKLDSLSNVTTQKVEKDFFTSLTEMVPDWEQVNQDAKFLAWLDEVDDLTGASRQTLLTQAEKSRDAARTAKFFTAFKRTSSSWAANSSQALDQQIVPDANRSPPTPPSKKVWTRAEVSDFYSRVRRGEIGDQQAVAIEADIHAAQIEGRIR